MGRRERVKFAEERSARVERGGRPWLYSNALISTMWNWVLGEEDIAVPHKI